MAETHVLLFVRGVATKLLPFKAPPLDIVLAQFLGSPGASACARCAQLCLQRWISISITQSVDVAAHAPEGSTLRFALPEEVPLERFRLHCSSTRAVATHRVLDVLVIVSITKGIRRGEAPKDAVLLHSGVLPVCVELVALECVVVAATRIT